MLRELGASALGLLLFGAPAAAQRADAFAVADLATRGRVLEAFAVRDAQRRGWLVALSAEAMPPDEKRFVTLFARGEPAGAVVIAIPQTVVAVDVADLGGAPGPELLLLEATQLRILDARGALLRKIALEPALPIAPRTRELSRLELARDWSGRGALEALLPDEAGLRLVPLSGTAPARRLALPVTAIYGDPQPGPPVRSGFFRTAVFWPSVFVADDDGDGMRDLVATTRYALTTYRGSASGLSARPSRTRRFPPFTFEEERRADTNLLLPDLGDLDGDGDADLIVHRTVGTLTGSRAETRIHENPGGGADPLATPAGTLTVAGGVATAKLSDLDGDGRAELLQSVLPFGIAQLARILVRSQAELELRVYGFDRNQLATPQLRWSDEITLPFDFKEGRVTALLPDFAGDFNGDGRRDLVYGDGDGNARIRLGAPGGGFGREAASVPLGASGGASLSADLDGDRLDELVFWDPVVQGGRLRVARNKSKLPGSPPRVAPAGP
ncbi:MAG: FG-GAP repeat domain-containing protein [Myxococcota bacterium]